MHACVRARRRQPSAPVRDAQLLAEVEREDELLEEAARDLLRQTLARRGTLHIRVEPPARPFSTPAAACAGQPLPQTQANKRARISLRWRPFG
jgi:hypothetical protein